MLTKEGFDANLAATSSLAFCRRAGLSHLPAAPLSLSAFIADQAGRYAVSTIQLRIAAVVHDNRQAGHGVDTHDPLVADALAGARQEFGA